MSRFSPLVTFKIATMTVVLGGALAVVACGGGGDSSDGNGGSGGDAGGSGGNTGGKGGSAGSKGGSGGGGSSGGGNIQARAVKNCSKGSTVGELENGLIKTTCATGSGCHTSVAFGSYKYSSTASFAVKFFDVKPRSFCTDGNDKIIDTKNPMDSFFIRKLKADKPKCLDGKEGGERMPYQLPALDAEVITCLEEYVKAVTAN
jgi:hypothetical protein